MRMTVADLMCESPITVRPECTTDEALELFFEYETTELFVVDKAGRLLGMLPDYELLKTQLSGEARGAKVEQLMSRSVPVFTADTDAAEAARLFRDNRYSRIPVTKSGRLVGQITRADVLRLMAVLRRMDAPVTKSIGPKRPKMLASPTAARKSRSKPVVKSTPAPSTGTRRGSRARATSSR